MSRPEDKPNTPPPRRSKSGPPPRPPGRRRETVVPPPPADVPRRTRIVIGSIVVTAVIWLIVGAIVFVRHFSSPVGDDLGETPLAAQEPAAGTERGSSTPTSPVERDPAPPESADEKPQPESPPESPEPEPSPPTPAASPDALPPPLHDVIEVHKQHLPLPPTEQNRGLSGNSSTERGNFARLAKVHVDDAEKMNLSIVGTDVVLPPGVQFVVMSEVAPDGKVKTWDITEMNQNGIAANGIPIGRFQLQNQILSFEWASNLRSSRLKYCLLQIDAENGAGRQTARCSLSDPIEQDPIRLNFDALVWRAQLEIEPDSLPAAEHLSMEVQLQGIQPSQVLIKGHSLRPIASERVGTVEDDDDRRSPMMAIEFLNPAGGGRDEERLVRVQLQLVESPHAPPMIVMHNLVYSALVESKAGGTSEMPPEVVIDTSRTPQAFARSEMQKRLRTMLSLKRDLLQEAKTLEKLVSQRAEVAASLASAGATSRSKAAAARRDLEQAEDRLRSYRAAIVVAERCDAWIDHLEEVYQDLEANVRIDFRLYIESDDGETDILRSRGFDSTANDVVTGGR